MDIPKRNVHVFSSSGEEVAGFFQHGGVSIEIAIRWITEVCYMSASWTLYPCEDADNSRAAGPALDFNGQNDLPPGSYVIRTLEPEVGPVSVSLTPDTPRTRAYSVNYTHTSRDAQFTDRVRARDRRCCIEGTQVAHDDFVGFQVACLFPPGETWSVSKPIQDNQGFLCSLTEYERFDAHLIGINPDDNYRIYEFVGRHSHVTPHGRTFYRNLDVPQNCLPSAELLRDHFRQCILRNVKGPSQLDKAPVFDLDLGGFKVSDSWWSATMGGRKVETEVTTPLRETSLST